jgi:hypothetical protein
MRKNMYNGSLWSGKNKKLSILVPTREMVHTHFAFSLSQLYKTTSEVMDTYLFFDSSSILLNQREKLIEESKAINSDYVLWLDSDMVFPSTAALRLLEHDKDIVGCNYLKRTKPLKPVAYKNIGDWDSYLPLTVQDELVKVEGVGMGCILMKTEIFKQIQKPYFEFTYNEKSDDWLGEDFNLLTKFRNIGYEVYIDTLLSSEIKHMGLYAYGTNK